VEEIGWLAGERQFKVQGNESLKILAQIFRIDRK
jgi:hypothetical protein